MKKKSAIVSIILGGLVLLFGFQNCSPQAIAFNEMPSTTLVDGEAVSDPIVDPGPIVDTGVVICDPLDGGSGCAASSKQGLIGNIYYLTAEQASTASLADYYVIGSKIETPLVMTQFNVSNRSFSSGFIIGKDASGENIYASDASGNKLVEWFALKVSGNIMVEAEDEGLYQFAINSDDGSKIFIDNELLIDNGSGHPELRMESEKLVSLSRNAKKSIEVHYYQGPAYFIALEVFIRKCEVQSSSTTCSQFADWKSLPASFLSHD